jgi:uncharacterized membrane protein YccC
MRPARSQYLLIDPAVLISSSHLPYCYLIDTSRITRWYSSFQETFPEVAARPALATAMVNPDAATYPF